MKLRLGLLISIIGTVLWTGMMYGLNQRFGSALSYQAVAGAKTTSFSHIPEVTSPLVSTINAARTVYSRGALVEDTRLNQLARLRLEDMVARNYYAHENPDGLNFADLLEANGLSKATLSCENLLLTSPATNEQYVREWQNSPAHADCMLDQNMTRVGIAEGLFDERTGQKIIVTIYAQSR